MKKKLFSLFFVLGFAALALTSCNGTYFPFQGTGDASKSPTEDIKTDLPSTTPSGSDVIPSGSDTIGGDVAPTDSTTPNLDKYSIRFMIDDILYKNLKTKGDQAIDMPVEPVKDGYTFVGWFLDKDTWKNELTESTLLDNPITNDIVVYAHFIEIKDAVIEILDADLKEIEGVGTAYFVRCVESQTSYNFSDNVSVIGNGSYIVTRDLNGKDEITSKNVELAKGENNVFFIHLKTNGKTVVYPVVLYRESGLRVSFDTLGGEEIEPIEIKNGMVLENVPIAVKRGYTFKGWNYDFTKPITNSVTVTANYEANRYTISYDYGYDNKLNVVNVLYDEDVKLESPKRLGYKFKGWSYNDTLINDFKYNYIENITLLASWEVETYTIKYNLNGGVYEGELKNEFSILNPISLPTPTKIGYTFLGFSTTNSEADIIEVTPGVDLFTNLDLNAIFTPNKYSLSLDVNGGNEVYDKIDVSFNAYIKLPTPTKEDSKFRGWYYGDKLVDNELLFNYTENITLVARWLDYIDYSVSVKAISGKPIENAVVKFKSGSDIIELTTNSNGIVVYHALPYEYDVEVIPPKGYILDKNNLTTNLTGKPIEFICNTKVIDGLAPISNVYNLYDVMYDFTLYDSKGNTYTLSKILNNKKLVILNFWYSQCPSCLKDFNFINEAYNSTSSLNRLYSEDVAFIAINPVLVSEYPEDQYFVDEFRSNFEYSFDMLTDYNVYDGNVYEPGKSFFGALSSMLKIDGFPTTVCIDRNGYINDIIKGGINSKEKWAGLFESYIGNNYKPKFSSESSDVFTPNNEEEPDYSKINEAVAGKNFDNTSFTASYDKNTIEADKPFAWPWAIGSDGVSLVPTNLGIDRSYSIININLELLKDQVFTFDIRYKTEKDYDLLYILVDDEVVEEISGMGEETLFAYVAQYTDLYKITLVYMKDLLLSDVDEMISLSNFRVEDSKVFESDPNDRYIYREASSGEYLEDLHKYEFYSNVVYNEVDGYYHVDSKNGPLIQAKLLEPTHFNPNESLFDMLSKTSLSSWIIDGVNCGEVILQYLEYTPDSLTGYVPVNKDLKKVLELIVKKFGMQEGVDNLNQWLELCVYFDVYGPTKIQMPSPIKGLAPFEAFELDYINQAGSVYYDRVLKGNGYLVEFKPTKSGVYKFTSLANVIHGGTELRIFDEKLNLLAADDKLSREFAIRYDSYDDTSNFSSYFYFDDAKSYYLCPTYYDKELIDITLSFKFEYIAPTFDVITAAALPTFTTDDSGYGDLINHIIISGFVEPMLGPDAYYIVKGGSMDSYIYFDSKLTLTTLGYSYNDLLTGGSFSNDTTAFDFTLDEFGSKRVNSKNEVLEVLKDADGIEQFDENGHYIYTNNVRKDKYGNPFVVYDARSRVQKLVNKNVIHSKDPSMDGLVKVDLELAEILQMLMDKYTFMGVDNSWLMLCYYKNSLGN